MRFLLMSLSLLHFLTPFINTQSINEVKSRNSIASKISPKRENGGTIEQMIGGHLLYRGIQKTLHDKLKTNSWELVLNPNISEIQNISANQNNIGVSLVVSSTGNGKNDQLFNSTTNKEENIKTLADQVNEGKYGLIHTELFRTPIKRPGVLSYKSNQEVPKDDASNYGGLKDDEIWLSEDHLLVLNGGSVNKNHVKEKWKPIDNYTAPLRQVKLPANPKVPPPFPVQLTDDAPIQFIGNNKFPIYNPFTNQTVFLFSNERVPNIQTEAFVKKNTPSWNGEENPPPKFNGYQYPPPAPLPIGEPNKTFSNPFLNLPPLAVGSIDDKNITDIDDEDNSLYYPPPYSFQYDSNYSNPVSPGPLVPGIILPPPPNFFAPLLEIEMSMKLHNGSKNVSSFRTNGRAKNKISPSKINDAMNTTKINAPKYNIEIEKVSVKAIPPTNNTDSIKSIQPNITRHSTKMRNKSKTNSIVKPQLQNENIADSLPLIKLNQQSMKGNPIYFEYFDARTSTIASVKEYTFTTPKPLTTTSKIEQGITTNDHQNSFQISSKRPLVKMYLPSRQKNKLHMVPNAENLHFNAVHEFSREIDNIRQTLHLYKNSPPPINNFRKQKSRPHYEYPFRMTPQIQTSYVGSLYQTPRNPFSSDVEHKPFNPESINYFNPIGISHSGNLQTYDKPFVNNLYRNREHALNVEISSANPHSDINVQAGKPGTQYFNQPSWFTVEKVKVFEIPKPLIYNNGASGYNTKIFLENQNSYLSPSKFSTVNLGELNKIQSSYRQSGTRKYDKFLQSQPQDLGRDILVNYKHPLPAINFESELLPYNRQISEPMINYKLPIDEASVYYVAPDGFKYQ